MVGATYSLTQGSSTIASDFTSGDPGACPGGGDAAADATMQASEKYNSRIGWLPLSCIALQRDSEKVGAVNRQVLAKGERQGPSVAAPKDAPGSCSGRADRAVWQAEDLRVRVTEIQGRLTAQPRSATGR